MNDKEVEKSRYDNRAKLSIENGNFNFSMSLPIYLKPPYDFYFHLLKRQDVKSKILEIGAGMGENTKLLLDFGFDVVATDISPKSVKMMNKRFSNYVGFSGQVGDMERLPFNDESFDVVCSAGSLSYGDNTVVMHEIHRVLKQGGVMIAVDSLNNNPIYRLNRFIHYLKGRRSLSVIRQTPNLKLLQEYDLKFKQTKLYFFGSIVYLAPALSKIFGKEVTARMLNFIDKIFFIKRTAFKFVLIARK